MRGLIRLWQRQGKTIIAAEHRSAYRWDLIDRAVILREGRIVRELGQKEKEELSEEMLAAMGLRSIRQEAPDQIDLPTIKEGDREIILREFCFRYPGTRQPVFEFPELRLAAGKITAITGTNGAGKTSFLSCLCGLEKHCRGKLEIDGKLYDRKARQKLCFMVMQDTGNQLFTESVLDEVLISLPKGMTNERARAVEILRQLDLDGFLDRHPQSLSGGQKQRLTIACALASGRKLLLLDEPTSGLDYAHMRETAVLLQQLQGMGATILVVTHDSELIRACCGRKLSFPEQSGRT